MFTAKFWKDTAERVIAQSAGTAAAFVAGDEIFSVWDTDWKMVAGVSLGAGFLSLMKALAARRVGDRESAALRRGPRQLKTSDHLHK